ncbi:alpha/beta hydrolase [Xenorhabdus innexi]|uniref:Phospholipase A n=1 Tax=Xenorhabdus innexi TaxID=290109 RepID=A0A1N6MV96_9GAMM|nr:alpha/beta hydrolase [Xenorhabdus innexi]PHM38239.1 phospholipase A [Xenorhabdus innexi]SIP72776.1 putative Phospholipase A(1) [Xenorhabdus innexi]
MTLATNISLLSQLGAIPLQGNQATPQSPSAGSILPDRNKQIPSTMTSLSENTKQADSLYQSLIVASQNRVMDTPELKANDIAGKDSKSIDYTLAQVTRDVYRRNSFGIGEYVRMSDEELVKAGIDPDILDDRTTGFQAGIYRNKGLYIVSFTGSNEIKDFMASIRQGLGYNEKQYNQAVALAQVALKTLGKNVIFTGHSMGGGLASMAALTTGKPAVTFNSAGVSDWTLKRMGWSPGAGREIAEQGLIRNYIVEHDWLDNLQKALPIPQPMGSQILLEYEYKPENFIDSIVRYSYALHSFKAHFLEAVQELLVIHKPWQGKGDSTGYGKESMMMAAASNDIQDNILHSNKESLLKTWAIDMNDDELDILFSQPYHSANPQQQLTREKVKQYYSV